LVIAATATFGGTACISISTAIIQRRKASNQTSGEFICQDARSVFGLPQGDRPEPANKKCPESKPRYAGILQIPMERQTMVKTHQNFVSRLTTKNYSFDATPFHRLLP
jgi:hypothetical protein